MAARVDAGSSDGQVLVSARSVGGAAKLLVAPTADPALAVLCVFVTHRGARHRVDVSQLVELDGELSSRGAVALNRAKGPWWAYFLARRPGRTSAFKISGFRDVSVEASVDEAGWVAVIDEIASPDQRITAHERDGVNATWSHLF